MINHHRAEIASRDEEDEDEVDDEIIYTYDTSYVAEFSIWDIQARCCRKSPGNDTAVMSERCREPGRKSACDHIHCYLTNLWPSLSASSSSLSSSLSKYVYPASCHGFTVLLHLRSHSLLPCCARCLLVRDSDCVECRCAQLLSKKKAGPLGISLMLDEVFRVCAAVSSDKGKDSLEFATSWSPSLSVLRWERLRPGKCLCL